MGVSRRTFLAWSGLLGGAALVAPSLGLSGGGLVETAAEAAGEEGKEAAYYTACARNCGSKCILKAYVKDGVITRMGSDDAVADDPNNPQLRMCLRGWSYRKRVYAPDRLKYPMKRVGKRGEGKFERISWDEAFDLYAQWLKEVKAQFGPGAIYCMDGSGSIDLALHSTWRQLGPRFFRMYGGGTEQTLSYSSGARTVATPYTLGNLANSSAPTFRQTKLMLMWGWNPAENGMGTNTAYFLRQAKERGCKVYVIDPRFTDTAASYADVWVPLKPGTDVAMMSAMAWVIINEKLQDQGFVEKYTEGWQEWFDYITGKEDGQPKTPEWAEPITGVQANLIRQMAREYAAVKPAALVMGLGPQRTAYGEQVARCGPSLAALTGNIGILGGYHALMNWMMAFPSDGMKTLPMPGKPTAALPCNQWPDLFLKGKSGGYPVDIHMAVATGANYLNQGGNLNKAITALQNEGLKYFVVHEQFMTPTAKFADLLLPINSLFERMDIAHANGAAVFMPQIIPSLYESKSDWEIMTQVARRLGFEQEWTGGKTEEAWLKELAATSKLIPDWETFKKQQIVRLDLATPIVAFKEQVQDGKPFPTPSGKIEISSKRIKEANNPKMPAVPKYIADWESPGDPLAQKYPLQFIAPHSKQRVHSAFHNVPWVREVEPHALWINPVDAASRGIQNDDTIRIFNDRGEVHIIAWVTERIMPGVVALTEGAWYDPEEPGKPGSIDRAGCANVLTSDRPTPFAGATSQHTCLVQVARR
ncbi:MAG TPA: molybdopterin-dependent oxidoreductase [Symbiobacteriaceae bacterium]|jgi:anaerobic dimethyl sulfoxide reductase subunit A